MKFDPERPPGWENPNIRSLGEEIVGWILILVLFVGLPLWGLFDLLF